MRLDKCPFEYYQLFRRALHEEVRIPLPTEADARALRSKLYSFRRLLQQQPERDPKLALTSSAVALSLEGNTLIARPSSDPRLMERIRQSMIA